VRKTGTCSQDTLYRTCSQDTLYQTCSQDILYPYNIRTHTHTLYPYNICTHTHILYPYNIRTHTHTLYPYNICTHTHTLYPYNHMCICAPVLELLEYSRMFGFEPICASDCRFCEGFPFCVFETRIQPWHLFCCLYELHLLTRIVWTNSFFGNFGSQKNTKFLRIVTCSHATICLFNSFGPCGSAPSAILDVGCVTDDSLQRKPPARIDFPVSRIASIKQNSIGSIKQSNTHSAYRLPSIAYRVNKTKQHTQRAQVLDRGHAGCITTAGFAPNSARLCLSLGLSIWMAPYCEGICLPRKQLFNSFMCTMTVQ